LRNDPAEIARMMAWIDDVVSPMELPLRTTHAVQLCLEEALTNIVSHAFEPGGEHDIGVAMWRGETALYAEVTDDGRAFDPLSHPLPAAPKDLASAPIGGLGIKLMRSFAHGVTYRRCGTTNRLTLSFALPGPG
jgi:anti-sigma regulatory factor (Ser/Thr protein kinase)